MKITRLISRFAVAGTFALASSVTLAHTVSIGYVPTSTLGTVTFYAGTYDHNTTPMDEETGHLVGVSNGYDSGTRPFNIPVVTTKPTGLINGTNNFFFAPSTPDGSCLSGTSFPSSTYTCSNGPIVYWEGLQFTGLSAGSYDFTIADDVRTTQLFQSSGSGTVRLTLLASDVQAVPEPTTVALLGLGLIGVAVMRRKSTS